MKVWIFQTGEPIPYVCAGSRPMRIMNLTNTLLKDGDEVTVWTSSFSHQLKDFLVENNYVDINKKNLKIRFIPSPGYKKNISISRLWDHLLLAYRLKLLLRNETQKPDVIFVGFPPILFAVVAWNWARQNKIPTMLDVKDQWPEAFVYNAPYFLKPVVKMAIWPSSLLVKRLFKQVDMVATISKGFMSWIYEYSSRTNQTQDYVFHLSPDRKLDKWLSFEGFEPPEVVNKRGVNILFVGSYAGVFDFEPIISAARYADENGCNWHFTLCGQGDKKRYLEELSAVLPNLKVRGSVDEIEYQELAAKADVGIAPYHATPDFQLSIPNKVLDYMSFGLPIITSLDGELGRFLKQECCGYVYDGKDHTSLITLLHFIESNADVVFRCATNSRQKFYSELQAEKVYAEMSRVLKTNVKSGE